LVPGYADLTIRKLSFNELKEAEDAKDTGGGGGDIRFSALKVRRVPARPCGKGKLEAR
jgi:hypothetical protein